MDQRYSQFYLNGQNTTDSGCEDFSDNYYPGVPVERFVSTLVDGRIIEAALCHQREIPDPSKAKNPWVDHDKYTELASLALEECLECPLFEKCPGAMALKNKSDVELSNNNREIYDRQFNTARQITRVLPNAVLKGGFAIILHGINRSTADLDFDLYGALNPTQIDRLKELLVSCTDSAFVTVKKNTGTTLRFVTNGLKVEFHYTGDALHSAADKENIEYIDGIRLYDIQHLIKTKVIACTKRTKARDILDLSYLINADDKQLAKIDKYLLSELYDKLKPICSNGRVSNDDLAELLSSDETIPDWVDIDVAKNILVHIITLLELALKEAKSSPNI